jgi:ribosomal protein S18 acetylase RimI-like enzyme
MHHRAATDADCQLLGELNHQLIKAEGHRNPMTPPELAERMRGWLQSEYAARMFAENDAIVAYALYRLQPSEIYLRQLFVIPHRRRQGLGRSAMETLMNEVWPRGRRLTVDVMTNNIAALDFWRSIGYRDYCLTLEIMPSV